MCATGRLWLLRQELREIFPGGRETNAPTLHQEAWAAHRSKCSCSLAPPAVRMHSVCNLARRRSRMRTFAEKPKAPEQASLAKSTVRNPAPIGQSHRVELTLRDCHPAAAAAIQKKLAINKPGDVYEQEADHIAGQVMQLADPGFAGTTAATLQRQGDQRHEVGGHPLPAADRSFFEPRFGFDFSGIRIFDDHAADHAADSVSALAYTVGSDIVLSAR